MLNKSIICNNVNYNKRFHSEKNIAFAQKKPLKFVYLQ